MRAASKSVQIAERAGGVDFTSSSKHCLHGLELPIGPVLTYDAAQREERFCKRTEEEEE